MTVALEETAASRLNEVVVVGYGTQKKSVVTGAISSVRAADLDDQPVVRVEQSLQGRTSGLVVSQTSGQPGSASTVRMRGITSLGGDAAGNNTKNSPLWVIDGVVIDNGGIGYLNQEDIESIEVLKDGASAAIYGTRAASGVILITTKKGKAGVLRVNYNGYWGEQAPAKKFELANASEYATLRNMSVKNANPAATLPFANPAQYGAGTDWQKTIFNYHAPKQDHEVSISGGNDKSTFFTSFGYTDLKGVIATDVSKWRRLNYRINTNFKPAKFISFGENLGYSYGKNAGVGEVNREFGGIVNSALNLDPITPYILSDTAAQRQFLPGGAAQRAALQTTADGRYYGVSPYVGNEIKNPGAAIRSRLGNYGWDHNIVGNAYVDITPVKGLVIHSTLGTKMAFYGSEAFNPTVYYNSSSSLGANNLTRVENWVINWNVENTASYNKVFGKHNVTLLGGWGEYADGLSHGATVVYNNIPAKNFDQASFRYNALPADRQSSSGSDGTLHRINSLFSRLQYNYDEKYLLTALIRRDGSSRFGANKKFGYFPSVSAGWVPTNENWFPHSNVINNMKIRASYGVTGQDGIGDFAYASNVDAGAQRNYSFGTTDAVYIGYSPSAPGNPNLHWEETHQTDFGVDAILFNTLSVTVDVYDKKTIGILQNPSIPLYAGYYNSFAQNSNTIDNKGIEVEVGYKKKFGDVSFGVNGNISFYKNKVTELLPGKTFLDDNVPAFQNLQGPITRTALGQAYNRFFGYNFLGVFQSQSDIDNYKSPKGVVLQPGAKPGDAKFANTNGDDAITVDDRTYLGNPNPTVSYGLTINLGYKNFDFIAFGSGSGGNQILQGYRRLDIATSNYPKKIPERLDGCQPFEPASSRRWRSQRQLHEDVTALSAKRQLLQAENAPDRLLPAQGNDQQMGYAKTACICADGKSADDHQI